MYITKSYMRWISINAFRICPEEGTINHADRYNIYLNISILFLPRVEKALEHPNIYVARAFISTCRMPCSYMLQVLVEFHLAAVALWDFV